MHERRLGSGDTCMSSTNPPNAYTKTYKTRTPKQFHDSTFPENMLDIWDYQFSWIEKVGQCEGLSITAFFVYMCIGGWVNWLRVFSVSTLLFISAGNGR